MSSARKLVCTLIPLATLLVVMVVNSIHYGENAGNGPNQIALLLVAVLTVVVGVVGLRQSYEKMENDIIHSVEVATKALLILLLVGGLIGVWILSGIVPSLVFFGLTLINANWFLPVAAFICAVVSTATGSSWSASGTVGIALMMIGQTLGIPDGLSAGAIISGAYFGDKMSPLSDTTNLASAVAEVNIFDHIRHMAITTFPAFALALFFYGVINHFYPGNASLAQIEQVGIELQRHFAISLWALLPPLVLVGLVMIKISALPSLLISIVMGIVTGVLLQKVPANGWYLGLVDCLANGFRLPGDSGILSQLCNRGGMSSMLSTIWLVLAALVFGGALKGSGILDILLSALTFFVRGRRSLIASTLGSGIFFNLTLGDQYLSIILPGRMLKGLFARWKLTNVALSRTLEDGGTVIAPLIPWNSGGAYNADVLGVSALIYAPFAFFNLLCPIISLLAFCFWRNFGGQIAEKTTTPFK